MPRPHPRRRTPVRAVLAALALTAVGLAPSPAAPAAAAPPRTRRRPPTSAPGSWCSTRRCRSPRSANARTRSGSSRSTPRCRRSGGACSSCPAPTAPTTEPLQIKVGYYTEVAGLGASPVRRGDQRQGRGLQPLPDRRPDAALLRRPQQLLALAVQPHHRRQRHRPGRLPRLGELLGDLAGVLAAPRRHPGRQPLADGLLHRRPAVRQRRLPRRLARRHGHQRLAAAVAHAQQRGGHLDQRRVEPGLRRHGRRAVRGELPDRALHHARPHPHQPREALPARR